jgi:hypothetical protein
MGPDLFHPPKGRKEPLPWYRFYPQSWLADRRISRLGWAEKGLLRELMDMCWTLGGVPLDPIELTLALGDDPSTSEIPGLLAAIVQFFVEEGGMLVSPFMEELRTEQDKMRADRARGGRKSAEGRKLSMRAGPALECSLDDPPPGGPYTAEQIELVFNSVEQS